MWYIIITKGKEKEIKTMKRYYDYIITNLNNGMFGVVHTEGACRMLNSHHIFETYEDAYKCAKACLFGEEPTDETTHH